MELAKPADVVPETVVRRGALQCRVVPDIVEKVGVSPSIDGFGK
jgi:hypothetical protein